MDYTYEAVLEACQDVKLKIKEKKNRQHMDMRNYLIALRYYRFFETEEYISKDFEIDRCSVNYAKSQPSMLLSVKDISFSANVATLAVQFPYDFPKIRDPKFKRSSSVIVYLDQSTIKKLDMFMMVKDIKRRDVAARELIIRALKLWEE
jgi:hypothetical protein